MTKQEAMECAEKPVGMEEINLRKILPKDSCATCKHKRKWGQAGPLPDPDSIYCGYNCKYGKCTPDCAAWRLKEKQTFCPIVWNTIICDKWESPND